MAHTRTVKKNVRQAARRATVNRARMSRIRTYVKKVEEAIASGKREDARAALLAAQPEIDRGVSKGLVQKNAAARKMSRLSARIKGMTA